MAASLSSFFTEWTKAKVRAGSTQSCNAYQCLIATRLSTVLRFLELIHHFHVDMFASMYFYTAPIFSCELQIIAIAIPFGLGSIVGAAQAKPTIDW